MPKKKHTCPRRVENGHAHPSSPLVGSGTDLDTWAFRAGKLRCSYCGSLHPDDFMNLVRIGSEIVPTDKSYKLYLDDYSKFYTQHLTHDQGWEFFDLWHDREINWGAPGSPYTPLYLPGPSHGPRDQEPQP